MYCLRSVVALSLIGIDGGWYIMYLNLSSHALKLSTCYISSPAKIFGASLSIYLVSHFQSHLILYNNTV